MCLPQWIELNAIMFILYKRIDDRGIVAGNEL